MPSRRSTGELLVLGIACTVCVFVLVLTVAIVIAEIADPDTDTSRAAYAVADVVTTLIGMMAGFLAGRTDRNREK